MSSSNRDRKSRIRRDQLYLAGLASIVSLSALVFYYRHNAILLYGDAVAHINIARRVFDSRTPGLVQLGTVWLPLPHLLDIPWIVNDHWWRSGVGASIPSMIAYVAGTLGIFRLVRGLASRAAAWIAALIYALNPNLIYMQATAMTESLYLALFIWSVVHFAEFVQQTGDDAKKARWSLENCGLLVAAAMLVRYDGWFLALILAISALLILLRQRAFAGPLRRGFVNFVVLTGLIAGLWLAYNHAAFDNSLEFANGPYSARAIAQRARTATMPSYPGENSLRTAMLYMVKVSRLTMGEDKAEYFLFTTAFVTLLGAIYFSRKFLVWLPLWIPLIFYAMVIAWGGVPIYLPEWWPFSYYNVRYGLQMLPAVAVFAALAYEFAAKFFPARWVCASALILIAASYVSIWQKGPLCLREAEANGRARMDFEARLAATLERLPRSATFLMNLSAHPGAMERADIRLERVVQEGNHPEWTVALSQPAQSADYVVAFGGDDVARAVRLFPNDLESIATVGTPGGPSAIIYRSRR